MLTLRLLHPRQAHGAVLNAWGLMKPVLAAGRRLVLHIEDEAQDRSEQCAYHARIHEIAETASLNGRRMSAEDWKRLLFDAFYRETRADQDLAPHWRRFGRLRTAPSLDGSGFVTLGMPTRHLSGELARAFAMWLDAVDAGVEISPALEVLPPRGGEAYMGRVKQLPCVLCELLGQTQTSVTDVHHIRTGQGGAQRADDHLTVAVCHATCHQGEFGLHGDKTLLRVAGVTELDLLARTIRALNA